LDRDKSAFQRLTETAAVKSSSVMKMAWPTNWKLEGHAMEFCGSARPLSLTGMTTACDALAVAPAALWAVLAVETRAFGFLPDRRPQILFERHVFHRLTGGRYDDIDAGISSAIPGGYAGGTAEYSRLDAAAALDRTAALSSASWGIGQLMGFNFQLAGFASVDAMVAAMTRDEDSQLLAVGTLLTGSGLAAAVGQQNWGAFARGYNGPDFQKNAYDTRLAAAYASYRVALPDLTYRAAQASLLYLGFDPGPIDGWRGRRTRAALLSFQQKNRLVTSGELDEQTEMQLAAAAFSV